MKRILLYIVAAAFLLTSCDGQFNFGMLQDSITPSSAELSAHSQIFTFEVKSGVEWNASLKEGVWCRIAIADPELKRIVISVDQAKTMEERVDTMCFITPEKIVEVPIRQAGLSSIFSTNHLVFSGIQSQTLSVNADTDWSVKIMQASEHRWLDLESASADAIVIKTVEDNVNVGSRDAVVRFTIGVDNFDINVTQAQTDAIIGEEKKFDLTYKSQNVSVNVETNVTYDVEIEGDWISRVETKALNRVCEVFAVAENETELDRKGKITLKYNDLSQVVEINQASRIKPLMGLNYGIYNESGETFVSYTKGQHQLSRVARTSKCSFRMIDVAANSFIDMSEIPADVKMGDRFTLKLNHNLTFSLKQSYNVKLAWIEGNKYWLLTDEGVVFVVKK